MNIEVAQQKRDALKAEKARIETLIASTLGLAEAKCERVRKEIEAIETETAITAAEWSRAVIAGAEGTPPPLPGPSTTLDVLKEQYEEAQRRATAEAVARAPIVARRDELTHLIRLAEEAVEKEIAFAMRGEARRVFRETQAALEVARELADVYESIASVLSPADSHVLPTLPNAVALLARSPSRIDAAKERWVLLRQMLARGPATLDDVDTLLAIRRQRAQAAAE